MNILITICGRGGSKGIPGKNIKPVNGLPLIAYTIRAARKFAETTAADVALSTDSDEILMVAAEHGLNTVYRRPAELASDSAGKIGVLRDVLGYEEKSRSKSYDLLLDLDITSPLRTQQDLEEGMKMICENADALNLFSVSKAQRNPYFNMVEQKSDGYYDLVKRGNFKTRQSAPAVYDMNASFYFYKKEFFTAGRTSAITERSLVYPMPHTCFDLDEPIDFEFMNYLLSEKKLDFEI
jgi:CMP-N,N'-diacetyllegionaminic acid synthase